MKPSMGWMHFCIQEVYLSQTPTPPQARSRIVPPQSSAHEPASISSEQLALYFMHNLVDRFLQVEKLLNCSLLPGYRRVAEGHDWEVMEWNLGGALGDRRAEFDNRHYVLLSGSYLSLCRKAYGIELALLARSRAAEKLLLSAFLLQNCICCTSLKPGTFGHAFFMADCS